MTHQIIRIIVYTENEKEARKKAEEILEGLTGDNYEPFDYGTFFDDNKSKVSGKARRGNLPAVSLANSKEGKKLISGGMKFTKDDFLRNMKEVRKKISFYSDEELFEEKIIDEKKKIIQALENKKDMGLSMFKYYCRSLGEYRGNHIWLYDNDGEGIRNKSRLKKVLNKWDSKDYKDLKVYVVPVDVHH